ncbi:MAG: hypothetical protein HC942_13880 [Microcoleus sp. SU_5_6]|nr:hypothetical protein [Microcoleus sp. SU_5_6]
MVIGHRSSVISQQRNNCQLSTINYQLSTINYQLSTAINSHQTKHK